VAGDVAVYLDDGVRPAGRVPAHRLPAVHEDRPAVGTAVAQFAGPQAGDEQRGVDLAPVAGGRVEQGGGAHAEQFRARAPVQRLGRSVAVRDPVLGVADQDGVVGQVEQGELAFERHDVRGEVPVGALAVGHVGDDGDGSGAVGQIMGREPELAVGHRDLADRRVHQPCRQVGDPQRGVGQPEQFAGGPVDPGHPAVAVDDDHTVRNRVEGGPVEPAPPESDLRGRADGGTEERGADPVGTPPGRTRRLDCHRLSIGRRMPYLIEHVF
jgi:hypothetical protein